VTFAMLGAQVPQAEKQLSSIGIKQNELGRAMRTHGLIGGLELLSKKLKVSGLDATEQAKVVSRAFGGGRQGATLLTLLQQLDVMKMKYRDIGAGANRSARRGSARRSSPSSPSSG